MARSCRSRCEPARDSGPFAAIGNGEDAESALSSSSRCPHAARSCCSFLRPRPRLPSDLLPYVHCVPPSPDPSLTHLLPRLPPTVPPPPNALTLTPTPPPHPPSLSGGGRRGTERRGRELSPPATRISTSSASAAIRSAVTSPCPPPPPPPPPARPSRAPSRFGWEGAKAPLRPPS